MVGAIIVAAGNSSRMNGINKLFTDIDGICVLARTLVNFEKCSEIDYIIVVTRSDMIEKVKEIVDKYKVKKVIDIVNGGITRQESVKNGVNVCPNGTEIIAIHDGARPFADSLLIENVIKNCKLYGASVPGVKVKDTVKVIENGFVESTPDRNSLFNIQTPQVFNFELYRLALNNAENDNKLFSDDSQLIEYAGKKVFITEGNYRNIKITTVEDIEIAKSFAKSIKEENRMATRIGHGYDVHKLVDNRKLILGGVDIPYEYGLLGHSDADVLVHSIMDAILGAMGKGDIGKLFPDSDDRYKGISSLYLLEQVIKLMENENYSIGNIDCTIIAQKPKLSSFVTKMSQNIARVCKTREENVNVKATTEEGLGFTGTGEGIAVHCVCLLV